MENHHVLMGKSTISMVMFNGYVELPEGMPHFPHGNVAAKMRKAIPVNLPLVLGNTSPTAFAAPVALGIMLQDAARPPRQSCQE